MGKKLLTIIIILMMLTGLSLLLYPTVSNYFLSLGYRQTITEYRAGVGKLDNTTYQSLLDEARAYNQRLAATSPYLRDPTEEELAEYFSLLDPVGTGVMGYVEIPKINVSLPIYHGTEESVLQSGIGHLAGTSLPVGGAGTHTIISGHRGLTSSRLFTDIDQLVIGDTFTLRTLNEVLTYEVDQIITILPSELGQQRIEPDGDYCTLLTCTPYGINTHRLLVRGRRVATAGEPGQAPSTPTQQETVTTPAPETGATVEENFVLVERAFHLLVGVGAFLAFLFVFLLLYWLRARKTYQPRRLRDKKE